MRVPANYVARPRSRPCNPNAPITRFDRLNAFVRTRNGWIVSAPGAETVTIEVLPGSILPSELRAAGYELTPAGEGERISPAAIVEKLTMTSSGAMEPIVEGSTKPVAEIRRHAGTVRIMRYVFSL